MKHVCKPPTVMLIDHYMAKQAKQLGHITFTHLHSERHGAYFPLKCIYVAVLSKTM